MSEFDEEALFEQMLADEGFETATERPIQARPSQQQTPLSLAQSRLWFLQKLDQQDPSYNINAAFLLEGALDVAALQSALNTVVDHHEVLRTCYLERDGVPFCQVLPRTDLPAFFTQHDLSSADALSRQERLRALADSLWHQPFAIDREGVLRLHLVKLETDRHVALLSVHHIAFDGWSMGVFVRDWSASYQALTQGQPLPQMAPLQYGDFAYHQQQNTSAEQEDAGLAYWCDLLADAPRHLPLQGDRPLPEVQSFRGGRELQHLDNELSQALKAFASKQDCSPFMLLYSAFAVLMARMAQVQDVVIGVPIAGRERPELEDLIGFFANTLALRSPLATDASFTETLQASRQRILAAFAHQDVAFEQVVNALQPNRSLKHTPLFQVMFSLQNTPQREADVAGLKISPLELAQPSAKFLLFLAMAETPNGFVAEWEFNADFFDAATVRMYAACFERLLRGLLASPQTPWSQLDMLPPEQRQTLLSRWQPVRRDFERTPLVHLIGAKAAAEPQATALMASLDHLAWSYEELWQRARRYAQVIDQRGLVLETPVAIYLERSPELVAVLLGIQLAGCCYVPLDPQFPSARNRLILQQAQPPLVMTQSELVADLADLDHIDFFYTDLEELPELVEDYSFSNIDPEHLSHVIYTSGSTGVPKGAAIRHGSVAALYDWSRNSFDPQDWHFVWAGTSLCFDLSVFEILLTLAHGGCVIMGRDILEIEESPHREQVTLLNTVPSALAALLRLRALPRNLRTINLAGEALPPTLARDIFALGSVQTLNNLYGPSEDTTYSTWAAQTSGAAITIGQPLHHTRAYVLDAHWQLCPVGIAGELFLAGEGLARGYVGQPQQTAARFVPDAYAETPGSRCYRTGDRARLDREGLIYYLGRFDHQLKIRGFRIEAGEIESLLIRHDAVAEALVSAESERASSEPQLLAHLIPSTHFLAQQQGEQAQSEHLQQWQHAWDSIYSGEHRGSDDMDLTGWVDRYTGSDIPQVQMAAWVEQTVARILALKPRRVLEIGCGTGLLLWRIAPHVDHYTGTDISNAVIEQLQRGLAHRDDALGEQVRLEVCSAHEVAQLGHERYDLIILNSVVQYFPSHDYLCDVLEQAAQLLTADGKLFLGDVRELAWLKTLHTEVAAVRSGPSAAVSACLQQAERSLLQEQELVLRGEWFATTAVKRFGFAAASLELKTAETLNELTRYRLDIVLSKAEPNQVWPSQRFTQADDAFWQAMASGEHQQLWLSQVENRNIDAALRAVMQGTGTYNESSFAELGEQFASQRFDELQQRASELGYHMRILRRPGTPDFQCECLFVREEGALLLPLASMTWPQDLPLANAPLQNRAHEQLIPQLRTFLAEHLPDYMVPSHLLVVQQWPRTPNGKLDRKALPQPQHVHTSGEVRRAPASDTERLVANVWEQLLDHPGLGADSHFFASGGHSLLAMRVIAALREATGKAIEPRALFAHPVLEDFAAFLDERRDQPLAAEQIPLRLGHPEGPAPLSPAQQRLWLTEQMQASGRAYHVAVRLDVRGQLYQNAVVHALGALVQRHDQLRVSFQLDDVYPQQVLHAELEVAVGQLSFAHLGMDEALEAAETAAQAEADRPFDLAQAPLFRLTVVEIGEAQWQLWLTFHHAIVDGWSLAVFAHDFATLYNAYLRDETPRLPSLALQYADFAAFMATQETRLAQQLRYWEAQLQGMPHALKLPRTVRGSWQDTQAATVDFTIDAAIHRRMQALQEAHGATAFMSYLAAFQALLAKYGCGLDVPVATPHAGRDLQALENLIGFFVNTLVMRGDLRGNPSFLTLLARMRALALSAFANRDLPFEKLVEVLQPERVAGSNPLTQVLFAMQNTPTAGLPLVDAEIVGTRQDTRHVRFDLELHMWPAGDAIKGQLIYRKAQFDAQTMQQMAQHFQHFVGELVRHPEAPVLSLPMMNQAEKQDCLRLGTAAAQAISGDTIHGFFEASALQLPDALALLCPHTQQGLSYAELNQQATQLAAFLQAEGAGPERGVAFFLERDASLMVALLGILKSGSFYVPLDPAYESERNRAILQDAGVTLLVTSSSLAEQCPQVDGVRHLYINDAPPTNDFTPPRLHRQNLAYLIYTSGSTGKPKGVAVTHGVTVTMLNWARDVFSEAERAAVAGVSSVCFDMSILELFGALSWGGSLVLLPDALALLDLADDVAITHINTVPSVMAELVARGLPKPGTKLITLGGEPLTATLVRNIEAANAEVRIVNMFGPAEDGYTSWTDVTSQEEPDLGVPVHNTRMYVLDDQGAPVPLNVGGEICLAGDGTARGYFGQPGLTAAKFTPDPFGTLGSRLYRSGDLGKWDDRGKLRYLGRSDHQIKIRGFRVEPGEVESLLAYHEAVAGCVVMAHREQANAPLKLVAFVVPNHSKVDLQAVLLDFLKAKLPSFMVPSHIELLPVLPRNPNGKIDRARLARMPLSRKQREVAASDFNQVQQVVHGAWLEVLGIEHAGLNDNFFDLGGHSLMMLRLRELLAQAFDCDVPLTELFRLPTIQQQATFFEAADRMVADVAMVEEEAVPDAPDEGVAIVGFAGRFPAADDVATLWQNLCDGLDAVQMLDDETCIAAGADPKDLAHPHYVKAAMPFGDYAAFDHEFFGFSKREAIELDPQHRHFLEVCWLALEHAGLDVQHYANVGVFAGCDPNYYFLEKLLPLAQKQGGAASAFRSMIGNDKDYLATRVAYKLNLKGPALTVQTACSTSLSAVHLACRAIRNGECGAALAGGVSIAPPNQRGYRHEDGMIHSRDGHCRAFDAQAGGVIGGQGAATVLLMSPSLAQQLGLTVYAVVRGSAMNNDGSDKVGYTAPGQSGQAQAIYQALRQARVKPESVGYVEAHGTGTPLGDPIEIAALQQAYRQAGWQGPSETRIGSLKTNVGHLGAAAGVSGLIKAVLCLYHKRFVPSLHFEQANPEIDFSNGPFQVAQRSEPWLAGQAPRRAGVSAFGIGGTNVHVILEEGDHKHVAMVHANAHDFGFPLSAPDVDRLFKRAEQLAQVYDQQYAAGFALQLQTGQNGMRERLHLRQAHFDPQSPQYRWWPKPIRAKTRPRVAFVYPGIHAQYVGVAREWASFSSAFSDALDNCCAAFKAHINFDVKAILLGESEPAEPRELCDHVANFCFAYAAGAFWQALGVIPSVVMGQSFGEWPAAVMAGAFDLATAAQLVAERGRLIAEAPAGAMLLVSANEAQLSPYLKSADVVLAAVNAPDRLVISGDIAKIESLRDQLKHDGILCSSLPVARAYHHPSLQTAADQFGDLLNQVLPDLQKAQLAVPMISSMDSGQLVERGTRADYWQQQMMAPVRLHDAMGQMANCADVIVEIGPDGSFTRALKRYWHSDSLAMLAVSAKRFDPAVVLGQLWCHGVTIDWREAGSCAVRMPTPAFPFKRISLAPDVSNAAPNQPQILDTILVEGTQSVVRREVEALLGTDQIGDHDSLFEVGFDSLMMVELLSKLTQHRAHELSVATIIEHPTIAAIEQRFLKHQAAKKEDVQTRVTTPNLVPLAFTHAAPPLFLVHPIGGSALIYRDLAQQLPDCSVIGIHAPGLVPDQQPESSFEKLVDLYVEQIISHQPSGPYALGGASFGGMLAYAIAVRLQKRGLEVRHLVLMDVLGPESVTAVWAPQELFVEGRVDLGRLRQVASENVWASQWLSPDQRSSKLPEQVLQVLAAHIEAIHQFRADRFEGEAHFLRAKTRLNLPPHPELEWYERADALHICNTPGNHFDMMLGENAVPLARTIRWCLRDLLD